MKCSGVRSDITLAGVVVLDTSRVPDVLSLRTRDADAKPVHVLPGKALDCVWVLILDVNVVDK